MLNSVSEIGKLFICLKLLHVGFIASAGDRSKGVKVQLSNKSVIGCNTLHGDYSY